MIISSNIFVNLICLFKNSVYYLWYSANQFQWSELWSIWVSGSIKLNIFLKHSAININRWGNKKSIQADVLASILKATPLSSLIIIINLLGKWL